MAIDKAIYVLFEKNGRLIELNAGGKNYLHKTALSKAAVCLVRLMVILILNLTKLNLKALHKLSDKLKRILESSCASYLEKHGKLIELRIIGKVGEVILGYTVFIRNKSKINSKSLTLNIYSCKLIASLREGLVIPACSGLNTLVRKKKILEGGIVILNVVLRLDQA